MNGENPVKTILVLSANPKGTKILRLDEEIREIEQGLQRSKKRDSFRFKSGQAVRDFDIHRSILDYEPQIIHFSGHGSGEQGLVIEDNIGQQKLVDAQALAGLFELFASQIECVVLNACYSEIQAKAIAQHIDYVIGMSKEIGDAAAIKFAVGFYDALGAGRDVEFAYKLGCRVIRMAVIPEHLTPQLFKKEDYCRKNIDTIPVPTSPPQDARNVTVIYPSSTATPTTAPPPKQEETIIKYRQQVEEFVDDGVISDIESHILENLQKKLGLTDQQAGKIREEVLEPYDIYKQQFTKKVAEQGYPLRETTQAELKKLQNYYKIKDEYINLLNQEAEKLIQTKPFEFETATLGKNLQITRSRGRAESFQEDLGNGVFLEMVKIPGGSFLMGSPENELERLDRESPQHKVTIQPFFMGKFPVTQEQYQAIMGENPSRFQGKKKPVESVSWNNVVEFCDKISKRTGKTYRLPSEAEWEYGCRAGTTTPFHFGETISTDLANYKGTDWNYEGKLYPGNYGSGSKGEYREQTTDVGSFPANAFGLYDMHGNVWEWCQDIWHDNYHGAPIDGTPWLDNGGNNNYRVLRGGSWNLNPEHCRSASRGYISPDNDFYDYGFRVVCGVAPRTH
ncbi:MAG: SUMF1/EgtB/PvdO family nonheme iron enzyme [Nostocales cyanobacterium 94392]|nr:SUMF1/EgtB/PvdO family nonheme iron enzyme [Nostocales cyanobacterium 94392]